MQKHVPWNIFKTSSKRQKQQQQRRTRTDKETVRSFPIDVKRDTLTPKILNIVNSLFVFVVHMIRSLCSGKDIIAV
ncbi:CLUMA_CG012300, isoform A [Clunio marinus]|uniref:CLUMA_CG012300, isoform A n=1 Tax=Clunio marinus TaxID=568069 RepID=A0A1J1IEQ4_9DIPT|nr:CLUMA_CG012300, isoform A [Clunio marinus]